jgi:hypothetical protein
MLPRPFTRQELRRSACVTLFAWLFALLSGAANACLVQADASGETPFGRLQREPITGDAAGATPTDRQVEHARDGENGDPANDGGMAGCLKFCADESSALAKSKASHTDIAGAIVLASSIHWPFVVPVAAVATWQPIERHASVGPPLFLRLLRLTI